MLKNKIVHFKTICNFGVENNKLLSKYDENIKIIKYF